MLLQSNYLEYILDRLYPSDECQEEPHEDQAQKLSAMSEMTSQVGSSNIQHRQTGNKPLRQDHLSNKQLPQIQVPHNSSAQQKNSAHRRIASSVEDSQSSEEETNEAGKARLHLQGDDSMEDNEVNENIINSYPKKLFSKVLAVFAQKYGLFRTKVLSKLSNGVIISRKAKLAKGLDTGGNNFDPLAYYEEQEARRKKTSLETLGFHKKLIRFDFDNGKLLYYSNKTAKPSVTKSGREEKLLAVNNKWVLEEEFDLDEVVDIVLPEVTVKMLKARMRQFYQPSQFGVYNQAELHYLERCEYLPFYLEIAGRGRVECLADDLGIFLDIYTGLCFLQH